MFTYGQPLDWDRIAALREPEHLEWLPDDRDRPGGVNHTQLCWTPKADGIHFHCEELPLNEHVRPGRYAHAIYDPETKHFTHADGAVRYYTAPQLQERRQLHVRNAGKAGTRVKVFTFDEPLSRDGWCSVIAALFVWNDDVNCYFESHVDGSVSGA